MLVFAQVHPAGVELGIVVLWKYYLYSLKDGQIKSYYYIIIPGTTINWGQSFQTTASLMLSYPKRWATLRGEIMIRTSSPPTILGFLIGINTTDSNQFSYDAGWAWIIYIGIKIFLRIWIIESLCGSELPCAVSHEVNWLIDLIISTVMAYYEYLTDFRVPMLWIFEAVYVRFYVTVKSNNLSQIPFLNSRSLHVAVRSRHRGPVPSYRREVYIAANL